MVAIKICGITTEEAVATLNKSTVDYAGFIYFPPSPRHLPLQKSAQLKLSLSKSIKSLLVAVDPDNALIAEIMAVLKPDYLQLHGSESAQRIREIHANYPHLKIIKSISVRSSDDIASAMKFADDCDMFLFDAKPPKNSLLPGGNGLSFDWNLLAGRTFSKPWMLSGGLNAENVREAIRQSGAQAIDVSSSVESAPGVKSPALIEAFVKAARNEI